MVKEAGMPDEEHDLMRKIIALDPEAKAALLTLVRKLSSARRGYPPGCGR